MLYWKMLVAGCLIILNGCAGSRCPLVKIPLILLHFTVSVNYLDVPQRSTGLWVAFKEPVYCVVSGPVMIDTWVKVFVRGHKKRVLQTRAPRGLGLFALCSEAQNMIFYSARKKLTFLPILQWFFWQKNSNMIWKTFNPAVKSGVFYITKNARTCWDLL